VQHKLRGQPYGVEDLDGSEQHDLVGVVVAERDWLDCVTVAGLEAVGLAPTYPYHRNRRPVRHADCQPIGQAASDDGRPGIAPAQPQRAPRRPTRSSPSSTETVTPVWV